MILVQGCSFTEGREVKDPSKFAWPAILKRLVEKNVVSLAESGKDNFVMHRELVTYLMWASKGKVKMPEIIVWQTTDHKRCSYYRMDASGLTMPNDLTSQTTEYVQRHAWHYAIGSNKTELVHTAPDGELVSAQELGDSTYVQHELQHCVDIVTMQTLCKSLGVRLVILNYNGHLHEMRGDPLFESIDRNDYVVYNSRFYGIHNQLMHMGFERFPCGHFDMDAHFYQADIIADFITNRRQVTVLENRFRDDTVPIYDYVTNNV